MRACSIAKSKLTEIMDIFYSNETKVNIKNLCENINDIAKNITSCNAQSYVRNKTDVKFLSVHYDPDDISFGPREKAKYYLDNFPNIKLLIEVAENLLIDPSSFYTLNEKEITEFNLSVLKELLDNPLFINAIYNYIWACIYSYDITTLWIKDFIDFTIETINSNTRENYIICSCR
jgi:hypothetical protein